MKATAVIVGGGPGGSTAAYTLLKEGIDVLLLDKSTFPRNKLCGGLLTGRTKRVFHEVFENGWADSFEYTAYGAGIFKGNTLLNEVAHHSELYQSQRYHFDDYLLKRCLDLGLRTHLGDAVLDVDFATNTLKLKSGLTISYDYLIGADGVNSAVAKNLFGQSFDKDKIGFALEVELPKGKREYPLPSLHFEVVKWGYGWVFPKENSDTFGLAGVHRLNPHMKENFQQFHETLFGERYQGKIHGHYIPFGDFKKQPGNGSNVLLVGDAAGLVEPITGEGIAFAMESGKFAGEAVVTGIHDHKMPYPLYMKAYKKLTKDLKVGYRLAKILYSEKMNPLFLKVLPRANFLVRLHMDLLQEKITYPQFQRYVFKKLATKSLELLKLSR